MIDFIAKKMQIRNLMTAVNLAASGFGVTFTNEKYATKFYLGKKPAVFSIGKEPIFMNLVIAYRKDTKLSQYAKQFIQIAKENY